jgi:hypothetical protein
MKLIQGAPTGIALVKTCVTRGNLWRDLWPNRETCVQVLRLALRLWT